MRSKFLFIYLIAVYACYLFMPEYAYAQTETHYAPIEPCRIFDTRQTNEMLAGETRNFFVFELDPGDIAGQGGKPGGCGIPSDALSIHINFTSVTPAGSGFMRAWAFGDSEPTATLMNWSGKNISNATAVPVCTGSCNFELSIKVYATATDLVGDVVGYYVPIPLVLQELAAEERALNEGLSIGRAE